VTEAASWDQSATKDVDGRCAAVPLERGRRRWRGCSESSELFDYCIRCFFHEVDAGFESCEALLRADFFLAPIWTTAADLGDGHEEAVEPELLGRHLRCSFVDLKPRAGLSMEEVRSLRVPFLFLIAGAARLRRTLSGRAAVEV